MRTRGLPESEWDIRSSLERDLSSDFLNFSIKVDFWGLRFMVLEGIDGNWGRAWFEVFRGFWGARTLTSNTGFKGILGFKGGVWIRGGDGLLALLVKVREEVFGGMIVKVLEVEKVTVVSNLEIWTVISESVKGISKSGVEGTEEPAVEGEERLEAFSTGLCEAISRERREGLEEEEERRGYWAPGMV